MKKLICCFTCALLLTASTALAGPIRNYIGLAPGLLLPDNSSVTDANHTLSKVGYKDGFSIAGIIGHDFGLGLRAEAEVDYKDAGLNTFRTGNTTYKLNAGTSNVGMLASVYYDILRYGGFAPYVGGGVGFANIQISGATANGTQLWNDDRDTAFAYQAGFGCSLKIQRELAVDLGYRYYGTDTFKIDQTSWKFGSHSVQLGLRYYIP